MIWMPCLVILYNPPPALVTHEEMTHGGFVISIYITQTRSGVFLGDNQ